MAIIWKETITAWMATEGGHRKWRQSAKKGFCLREELHHKSSPLLFSKLITRMSTITKDGRCIIIHHTSYWTNISSKSYTRKEIVGNLIWSLQVWWEDHKGSELLSFWIDHIFNPHVSFVAICAPFLIFGFVTYEESQGRIFFLRWDFLMTSAVSLTDSFLFTVTAPSLDLAFQVPFITHTRPSLSPRSFLLDQIRKLRRLSEYKKYKVDHQ